ncbi:MAG: hypothetical protein PF541_05730 [Prolixibacteraceae bacterium]|jgi:hypothetical protein|nr:hypothetical protein [Prolixibacteraceae bacterium]
MKEINNLLTEIFNSFSEALNIYITTKELDLKAIPVYAPKKNLFQKRR